MAAVWQGRITHFWVAACLSFKTSLGAPPFKCKWLAYSYANQTHFPYNSWAPRLTSKPRLTATRKWPIPLCLCCVSFSHNASEHKHKRKHTKKQNFWSMSLCLRQPRFHGEISVVMLGLLLASLIRLNTAGSKEVSFSAGWGTNKAENIFLTHSWENGVQCVGGLQGWWFLAIRHCQTCPYHPPLMSFFSAAL